MTELIEATNLLDHSPNVLEHWLSLGATRGTHSGEVWDANNSNAIASTDSSTTRVDRL